VVAAKTTLTSVQATPSTQYATDRNLAARQRLWGYQRGGIKLVDWVLGLVEWDGAGAVVDVGCGNGLYLQALRERSVEAVGCDLSLGMLRSAGRHLLVAADANRLPFGDGSFGVVLAAHMLYHVKNLVDTANELRRVLARGGVLVAVTNGAGHLRSLRDLVDSAVAISDPGWRMLDPALQAFSLENGPGRLADAFTIVDVVRPDVAGQVLIDDPTVITDYLSSVADTYGREISQPWADVVEAVRQQVQKIIDRDGHFVTGGDVGAIVCT
jgi:SAM-dependent methyltransferase